MKTLVLSMISIAATVAAMTACTSENDPVDEIQNEVKVPINFGQSINVFSKAIVTGDKLVSTTIGIWGQEYQSTAEWTATNFMDNLSLTVDVNGAITYTTTSDQKYYSIVDGTKYDFCAYSPLATADNGIQTNAAGVGTAPTLTVNLTKQTDVMQANIASQTKASTGIELPFKHTLAQIKFTIKKEAGVNATKLTDITVNANTSGTMSLADGTYSSTGTSSDFKALTSGDVAIGVDSKDAGDPLLLFPEALASNSVKFKIDGKDYSFTPSATLTAGKITTINVTISATGVDFTQSLTDWGTENDGSGEIK